MDSLFYFYYYGTYLSDTFISVDTEAIHIIVEVLVMLITVFGALYTVRRDNKKRHENYAKMEHIRSLDKKIQEAEIRNKEARTEILSEINVKINGVENSIGNRIGDMRDNMNSRFTELTNLLGQHLSK